MENVSAPTAAVGGALRKAIRQQLPDDHEGDIFVRVEGEMHGAIGKEASFAGRIMHRSEYQP
ncbi:hypothetical protein [Pseudomonas sp. RIT-PI-AD]|uniref:hypothetical protein n=1 Tax=Pseudomonas sp. RIT-PI-AD TaxID=3035294 RepID=UPI0021D8AB3D|nr:hypothetical protein [Pseudomonas sp. RIT-PI-AD]